MPAQPLLLLTGGTGFVGRALAPHLQRAHRVVVLSRNDHPAVLRGDVSQPLLGLSTERYRDLQQSLTDIVHAAADIRFESPLAASRATNREGTRHLLDLARGCPHLRRFAHIGTVYVNGLRRGDFHEEPIPAGHGYINTYQQSKHEAEALVLAAMSEIPAVIYRMSTVVADSPLGVVSQFNYVHQLIRHLPESPWPVIPGDPQASLDLIDNQWATAALAHLFEHHFQPGSIRHLCAGPEGSLPILDAFRLGREALESLGAGPVHVPELVPPAEFHRYLALHPTSAMRGMASVLSRFLPLLSLANRYHNSLASADLASSGLVRADVRNYFGKVVKYCVETNWGKTA
jgi:nucleoside-diphosphate-sugar epimerase